MQKAAAKEARFGAHFILIEKSHPMFHAKPFLRFRTNPYDALASLLLDPSARTRIYALHPPPTMPTEVADSDAESDLETPPTLPPQPPGWPAGDPPSEASNGCGVNFSDFLQHSPRLTAEEESPVRAIAGHAAARSGSTLEQEHAVRREPDGIGNPENASAAPVPKFNNKRRHTELEDGLSEGEVKACSSKEDRKRRETHGSGGSRLRSCQSDAFEHLIHAEDKHNNVQNEDSTPHPIRRFFQPNNREPLMQAPSPKSLHDDDEELRREYHEQRLASIGSTKSPLSNITQEISTSRSSMGNYHSINADLRGSGNGKNAKQLGSLSQTSLEEDIALKSVNGNDNGTDGGPNRARSIDPLLLYHDVPHDTQVLSSSTGSSRKRRKTDTEELESFTSSGDVRPIQRSASVASSALAGKKRGRKPKGQKVSSESPYAANGQEENPFKEETAIGLPKELSQPRSSKSRSGTNERLSREPSQASEARSENPKTKKRKKTDAAEESPIKQPTSELHLSDEAYVGLPKEQYKPRPSRSRSKRTIDEEDDTQPELEVNVPVQGANQNEKPLQEPTHQFATPAKPKKSAKKTAVKRGKTVMPKRGQAMFSDGEDEVVWVETQPNKVKLDLPGDISPEKNIKQEPVAPKDAEQDCCIKKPSANVLEEEAQSAQNPDRVTRTTNTDHIIVHIPLPAAKTALKETKQEGRNNKSTEIVNDNQEDDSEVDFHVENSDNQPWGPTKHKAKKPEPKKGGRKSKSAEKIIDSDGDEAEAEAEVEADSPSEAEEEIPAKPKPEPKKRGRKRKDMAPSVAKETTNPAPPPSTARPALADKSPNISTPAAEAPSPTKDHLSENKNENENKPAETPEKKIEKGPTKHSPINPAGGKALYRVGLSRRAAIQPLLKIVRK